MLISNGQATALADTETIGGNAALTYAAHDSIGLSDEWVSYGEIYRKQLWVHTLVNKVAFAVARLPLPVYKRGDNGRTAQRDSPYAKLLRNPNPRQDPFFFWLWTASTYEIYGEAIWIKFRPARGLPPTQLWPIHPANIVTRRNDSGDLIYRYVRGGFGPPLMEWTADDVVHFKAYNPINQVRGLSRLEALNATLLAEDAARRGSAALWRNGARPSVALKTPNKLSDVAYARLQASWNSKHSGVENWAKTAILEEGIEAQVLQLNAEEMQYIESRRINREEACGLYDVPPPVVHILDRATFSNITEQMRSMYRDTMAPRLGLYESALDVQLRPDFDPTGSLYAEFLMDEVMRGAFEQRATAYQQAIAGGWMKPSEVRQLENLPDAGPESDRLYINAATIPMAVSVEIEQSTGGEQVSSSPQKVKALALTPCAGCDIAVESVSKRGLCRPCEGRMSRLLAPKEITR